jgi:MrfA Zn-binding domain/Helicase conserved C-terminal domain
MLRSRAQRGVSKHEGSAAPSFETGAARPPASYTGRTPYPGPRNATRDAERIEPLFESFYLPILSNPANEAQLRAIGQLPEKDLRRFYAKDLEETKATKGGPRLYRHWDRRLVTQPGDRELMIRDETQRRCPDILITNYSMLEYMLMRPIEREIFTQTRNWLYAHEKNELVLVLDEAHMYRGAGGAEVALLLRRLFSRLEVPREKVRFILTSASLGEGEEAERAVLKFGRDLTGLADNSSRTLQLVRGTKEARQGAAPATREQATAFAAFDLAAFERHVSDQEAAQQAVRDLCNALGVKSPSKGTDLADFLYHMLSGFGPLELLIELVSGKAIKLENLQDKVFPGARRSDQATASLLALATFAKRLSDGRVLLPTRMHMFFRGLPGLFACSNPACDHPRENHAQPILGRLHTHSHDQCDCGGRVYELLTHRECGTAFLRGYMEGQHGDFLWHSPSGPLREGPQTPLTAVEFLVDGAPHPKQVANCIPVWLDVRSGRLVYDQPLANAGYLRMFMPAASAEWARGGCRFTSCPVCIDKTVRGDRSSIMDHSTKGEAPFANLVKTQLDSQPAVREETRTFPNGGRKVLLFSDGRQKAARLARDIPREVEQDIFRQVLSLACARLVEIDREPRPTIHLYVAVLTVLRDFNLAIFDRNDAQTIEDEVSKLERDHEGEDLEDILRDFSPTDIPPRYKAALLRQLCGRYYSLSGTSIGFLEPIKRSLVKLRTAMRAAVPTLTDADVDSLSVSWISALADRFALDHTINDLTRGKAAGYYTSQWGSDGRYEKDFRTELPSILSISDESVSSIEKCLLDELAIRGDAGSYFLEPSKLRIRIALDHIWYQCQACTALLPVNLRGRCGSCGAPSPQPINPDSSEYIRARKGFWRQPVAEALGASARLRSISVEEHTAQLSNRDNARVHATTEQFELRFKDIQLDRKDKPIDVLSCTTTMEVGVDIGSLVAVGLRNVPPQRENYQQRAGRAGRRGSSVSTVLTYAQNGPHDNYYYNDPTQIVAGPPRNPDLKIDNPKIARRHVTSFLFQTFFHRYMDERGITVGGKTSALFKALGKANDFFFGDGSTGPQFDAFKKWVTDNVIAKAGVVRKLIGTWLPSSLRTGSLSIDAWIEQVARDLLRRLDDIKAELQPSQAPPDEPAEDQTSSEREERNAIGDEELLEFLFARGMLPSYAFPTDLTSFLVEKLVKKPGSRNEWKIEIVQRPQQAIDKALSEYAPGRLIVINKDTYRSGGVVANVLPTVHDRAAPLFVNTTALIHCDNCSYVRDLDSKLPADAKCPVCGTELQHMNMVVPEVFTPQDARALDDDDRDQEITYATSAQFPVPVGTSDVPDLQKISDNISFVITPDRKLVTVNKGQLFDDSYQGFWVCEKCGRSETEEPQAGPHRRPYEIEFSFGMPRPPRMCNGQYQNVFLGHIFNTDLLLLRIVVRKPIVTDTTHSVMLRALEDGLYSIAEALRLAARRHPPLHPYPSEFGAGFRIVPVEGKDELYLDVYLYDTLSGGAGYAELAGENLKGILKDTLTLLEDCTAGCDRSCESCLRHYHNQHLKDRLDRSTGAQLLRHALTDRLPEELSVREQARALSPLKRLLELDGFSCQSEAAYAGKTVPLLVSKGSKQLAVGIQSGLLDASWNQHSLSPLASSNRAILLNEFILRRNLPDEHQLIRRMF